MNPIKLIPVNEKLEENPDFAANPLCNDSLQMTIEYYKKAGFNPPWIGYYASQDGLLKGAAGIKGKPVNGTIEIAYGTFEQYKKQGIGTQICRALVHLSLTSDPSVRITARTLPENNFSTKILIKNNFRFIGNIHDPEDGDVWEWEYIK